MIEQLNQLIHDSRLTSYHVSLYIALLLKTAQEGETIIIDRKDMMEQSKIRSRSTYTRCLHQLQDWGYLSYKPAPNQFQFSKIRIAMPINAPSSYSAMLTNGHSNESVMPINEQSTFPAMLNNEPSNHSAMLKSEQSNFSAMSKNEHGNICQTIDNQATNFAMSKSEHSKISQPPPPSSSAYKRDKNNLVLKKNDVADADDDATLNEVGQLKSKKQSTDHPFSQSPYFYWPTFENALAETNHKQNIDLKYYHEALRDWRDKESGLPPLRSDWLRTARVFMRNDAKYNKLVLKKEATFPQKHSLSTQQPLIIDNDKYRRT
jgi:hypothetical protein